MKLLLSDAWVSLSGRNEVLLDVRTRVLRNVEVGAAALAHQVQVPARTRSEGAPWVPRAQPATVAILSLG